jgi:(p)ppGpp synthase/HD superfamily hydrolase
MSGSGDFHVLRAVRTQQSLVMDSLILKSARLANRLHAGQMRKYRPRPYIEHPARVAGRLMLCEDATAEEVAAAWLHDVLEDCAVTADNLLAEGMPPATVKLVEELTNPSKKHPHLRRAERKEMDREHVLHVSREAKRIKLIDRADNLRDIAGCSDDFQSLYVAESVLLADILGGVDDALLEGLYRAIEELGFSRDHRDSRTAAK